MPSTLPAFISGGQPLVSGSVYSGRQPPITGVRLRLSSEVSGLVYVGAFSGGITQKAGGALSSGGLIDGIEMAPGNTLDFTLPPGGLSQVFVGVPAAISGTMRVFWNPYGGGNSFGG